MIDSSTLFAWHHQARALVALDQEKKAGTLWPLPFLHACGWKVTEEDLRKALPAFDQTSIVGGNPSTIASAQALAQQKAAFERRLRGK